MIVLISFFLKYSCLHMLKHSFSNNKCVFGSYGIHPHEAKNHQSIKSEDIIKKTKLNKKIIGIGKVVPLQTYYLPTFHINALTLLRLELKS